MFTGLISSPITSPIEHIRIRIQTQTRNQPELYSGSVDAFIKIYKEHGFFRGIEKGFIATVYRNIISFGSYFAFYEEISKQLVHGDINKNKTPFQMMIAGGLAGSLSWLCCYPLDSFKSMAQSDAFVNGSYKNYRNLVVKSIQERGIVGLYAGISVVLVRSFPSNAVTIVCYETCRNSSIGKK